MIVAFWALESDFGAGMGNLSVLRSLATLAYDCRRSEMFRDELMDALRIIDRGDLRPEEMIGSWAGELGQTQFLPSHYLKHAVDFDGDGRRNLMKSTPDVIASTANFLVFLGWQRSQPWLQEVKVTRNLPWDQADLAIQHPRSKWAGVGREPAGRAAPAGRCHAGLAGLADGALRAGVPGLPELPGLPEMEPVAELCADRRASGGAGSAARRR